jgi:hypothetical protein
VKLGRQPYPIFLVGIDFAVNTVVYLTWKFRRAGRRPHKGLTGFQAMAENADFEAGQAARSNLRMI